MEYIEGIYIALGFSHCRSGSKVGVSVSQLFSLSRFLFLLFFCFPAIALAPLSHFTLALPTTPFISLKYLHFSH